jgi:hypothetical protein
MRIAKIIFKRVKAIKHRNIDFEFYNKICLPIVYPDPFESILFFTKIILILKEFLSDLFD